MADFKKLQVWQHAHTLALETYRIAQQIRGAHHMSLRSQLIRSSASVAANIVEGRAKRTDRDFARFLGYALGSASELEYHILMGRDIGVISSRDFTYLRSQLVKVRKMLHGLIDTVTGAAEPDGPKAQSALTSPKPAAG